MARAATTTDAFNAVAEPRRREILDALAGGERPVNDLVAAIGLAQPQVSKHLRVLREVGLVDVREDGRRRLYRLNGRSLKPIHDWVRAFEETWTHRFTRLDTVLEELIDEEEGDGNDGEEHERGGDAAYRDPDRDHARVRRAATPRVPGVDDARADRTVVER
jgi:DNA-binding transcriptional ArsR family regulator